MKLCADRQMSEEDDGQPDAVTVQVEVKKGGGGLCEMVAAGAFWQHLPVRYTESNTSRAGNGTKTYVVRQPGLYRAHSMWRSFQFHWVYFEVTQDGEKLALKVLGQDLEHAEPTTLRELEQRWGVAEARAQLRAKEREEREALASQLESTGSIVLEEARVRLSITGLRLPALKGTEKQVKWASDLRATELRGFLKTCLKKLVDFKGVQDWDGQVEDMRVFCALVQGVLAQRVDSRWWIDFQSSEKDGGSTLRPAVQFAIRGAKREALPRPVAPLEVEVTVLP